MMKSYATKVNPDLAKERAKASFDTAELTHLLHGGQEKTERKRFLGKIRGYNLSLVYKHNKGFTSV